MGTNLGGTASESPVAMGQLSPGKIHNYLLPWKISSEDHARANRHPEF